MKLTPDQILALEPGQEFNALVAEAIGWQWWFDKSLRQEVLFRPGNAEWLPNEPYRWERIEQPTGRYPVSRKYVDNLTGELLHGIRLYFWLVERYGSAHMRADMEMYDQPHMCEVSCEGVSSWFAPLPVAVGRVILLLHNQESEEAQPK